MDKNIIQHPNSFQHENSFGGIDRLLNEIACHCQNPDFRQIYENDVSIVKEIIKRKKIKLPLPNKKSGDKNIMPLHGDSYFTGNFEIDELVRFMLSYPDFKKYVLADLKPIMEMANES